jgi:hypothetical protein
VDILDFLAWTGLELSTAMICASAPVIKPLLRKCVLLKGWMTTLSSDEEMGTGERTWTGQSEIRKSTRVSVVGSRHVVQDSYSEERLTRPNEELEAQIEMNWSGKGDKREIESVAVAL